MATNNWQYIVFIQNQTNSDTADGGAFDSRN